MFSTIAELAIDSVAKVAMPANVTVVIRNVPNIAIGVLPAMWFMLFEQPAHCGVNILDSAVFNEFG
ncbi:hypothetical protein [Novosphingobium acidiphilum]|uniref:hypothetical protein n=1 Tax=Novosphingobium acidiphilum TaxID=505248 RepID=UPI00146F986A|nr:hypothetical protein [Novosphingobium acidiphilum]